MKNKPKPRPPTYVTFTIATTLGILLLLLLLGAWIWWYQRGYDPRIQASGAAPIIKALQTYQLAKGKYPAKPSDLTPYLPGQITAIDTLGTYTNTMGFGLYGPTHGVTWHYEPAPTGTGYQLWRQLRDDNLSYEVNGKQSAWLWSRGDGVSEPVKLNIKP